MLTKAQQAANANKEAGAKDKVATEVLASYDTNGKLNAETLKSNIENHTGGTATLDSTSKDKFPVKVTVDGYAFTIASNGNITEGNETGGTTPEPTVKMGFLDFEGPDSWIDRIKERFINPVLKITRKSDSYVVKQIEISKLDEYEDVFVEDNFVEIALEPETYSLELIVYYENGVWGGGSHSYDQELQEGRIPLFLDDLLRDEKEVLDLTIHEGESVHVLMSQF